MRAKHKGLAALVARPFHSRSRGLSETDVAEVVCLVRFETKGDALHIDGKKVLRAWETFSGAMHYATEDHGEQEYVIEGRTVKGREFFGYVAGLTPGGDEWGYFTDAEFKLLIEKGKMWEVKPHDLPSARRHE